MNVLVTSISKKIPLLLAVKEACSRIHEVEVKLIGADIDGQALGRFFVDHFWQMPKLQTLHIETFLHHCKRMGIEAIIPTRDGELLYFAKHKTLLEKNGISVMVSPLVNVEACLDKLKFYRFGKKLGFPVIPTFTSVHDIKTDQVVVKERFGAGSISIGLNLSKPEAEKHAESLNSPIYQPYVEGKEYSIDSYVTKKGIVKGIIVRSRDIVINGESQVTTTLTFPELEHLAKNFISEFNLYGHVILQMIEDKNQNLHVVECNSRFGGASTLSIAAGLDSFYWFLFETLGKDLNILPFVRSEKEKQLVRHPFDYIFDVEGD